MMLTSDFVKRVNKIVKRTREARYDFLEAGYFFPRSAVHTRRHAKRDRKRAFRRAPLELEMS